MNVQNLKALVSGELPEIPAGSMHIYYHGVLLTDPQKSLQEYGIKEDDLVAVFPATSQRPTAQPRAQSQAQLQRARIENDAEQIRLQLLANSQEQNRLRGDYPELIGALNDPTRFCEVFIDMQRKKDEAQRERQREIVCPRLYPDV